MYSFSSYTESVSVSTMTVFTVSSDAKLTAWEEIRVKSTSAVAVFAAFVAT